MRGANFIITEDDFLQKQALVIRDVGPWDKYPTVTNDAEGVVARLHSEGRLPAGRRLFYIDSDGQKDELLHEKGVFKGFAPGPRERSAS